MTEVDDAARELPKTVISQNSSITFENDEAYAKIEALSKKEVYTVNLDLFIKESKVDASLGENGSLLYKREDGSQIIIPNKGLQALNFINSVIEREERDNILSETEIIAKNKAIQLEDASKNLRDWSDYQPQDIIWENNRIEFEGRNINLNGTTILQALQEPQILGEKVRIKYSNRKGEESIYYFSLDQISKIIDISNNQYLKGTKEKIDMLRKRDIPTITFNNPKIEDNLIVSNKLRIPTVFLEEDYQVHRAIRKNNNSYTVSLYVKGSGNPYRLNFELDDYNKLLQQTA